MTLLKIWGKEHGPWMQALHCVFRIRRSGWTIWFQNRSSQKTRSQNRYCVRDMYTIIFLPRTSDCFTERFFMKALPLRLVHTQSQLFDISFQGRSNHQHRELVMGPFFASDTNAHDDVTCEHTFCNV